MHILDTDILTLGHIGHEKVVNRIRQLGVENVATTVITAIEILRGRQEFLLKAADGKQLLRAQELLIQSERLLEEIQLIPVDAGAAVQFDRLLQNKSLRKIGRGDLLIASSVLARRATLVTRNLKHFQLVSGLNIENWLN